MGLSLQQAGQPHGVRSRRSVRSRNRLFWAAVQGDLGILGRAVVVTPAAVVIAFGLLAGVSALMGAPPSRVWWLLSAVPEVGLSLSAGLGAAMAVLADPGVELQLSLPTGYARTALRRLAVVFVVHAGLAATITALLQLAGWWTPPLGVLAAQLAWFTPTLWLMGLGAVTALTAGSRSAAGGVLGVWWVMQNLFVPLFVQQQWSRQLLLFVTAHIPGADFWLANRLWLGLQAAALLVLAKWWLHRDEATLARHE